MSRRLSRDREAVRCLRAPHSAPRGVGTPVSLWHCPGVAPCPRPLPPFPCLCLCCSPALRPGCCWPPSGGRLTLGGGVQSRAVRAAGVTGWLPTCQGDLDRCPPPLLVKLFTREVERRCPSSGNSSMGRRDTVPATENGSVGEGPGEPPRGLLIGLQGWRDRDVPAHASLPTAGGLQSQRRPGARVLGPAPLTRAPAYAAGGPSRARTHVRRSPGAPRRARCQGLGLPWVLLRAPAGALWAAVGSWCREGPRPPSAPHTHVPKCGTCRLLSCPLTMEPHAALRPLAGGLGALGTVPPGAWGPACRAADWLAKRLGQHQGPGVEAPQAWPS